jgi:DNA modification methylase
MKTNKIVNGYRLIQIDLDKTLSNQELNILSELEKIFPKTDFFFSSKTSDSKLIFHLREIDLNYFKNNIKKLIIENKLKESDNIFFKLIEKIEKIKSYGLKEGKRLYIDYNKERKVKNRKEKELERGMYYYALDHNFSKENNKVPSEFTNKILYGDSEEILKKLPSNCVDLVFTSPPYNFGLEYEGHEDSIDWNRYFDKLFAILEECIRVLKYGGRIIVDVQPLFSDYIPIHHILSNFFIDNKLIWRGEILWEKHNYNCKYTAWGSWKSPSSPYLKYTWEFLEVFCKGDLKHKGDSNRADITEDEFKKWVYAKWDIAPERNMKKYGHPAVFPEELVKRVLKLYSFERDVILDPFNGVGSTTKVAKEFNRRFIGIDISEEYCRKAEERLKETSYQKTLH